AFARHGRALGAAHASPDVVARRRARLGPRGRTRAALGVAARVDRPAVPGLPADIVRRKDGGAAPDRGRGRTRRRPT
ncbi:hypothetical protein THAOC_11118, partial [Thalassiosira oceanica]